LSGHSLTIFIFAGTFKQFEKIQKKIILLARPKT